jgi:hypothetical protein
MGEQRQKPWENDDGPHPTRIFGSFIDNTLRFRSSLWRIGSDVGWRVIDSYAGIE